MKSVNDWVIDCFKNPNTKAVWREQMRSVKDWAIDYLMKPRAGCQEGEGRKTATVRVVELSRERLSPHMGLVKVEEYEV